MTETEIIHLAKTVSDMVVARLQPDNDACGWSEACKILGCSRRKLGYIVAENPSVKTGPRTYSRKWLNFVKKAMLSRNGKVSA